jgi:hypothetical protein
MKVFGWATLAAIGGYVIGIFDGILLLGAFSPNIHDRSVEAAMTGTFVAGPLMAVVVLVMVLV